MQRKTGALYDRLDAALSGAPQDLKGCMSPCQEAYGLDHLRHFSFSKDETQSGEL
ncbi:MAG: hypothetical protein WBN94_02635 [Methanothrix sp.]